MCECKGPGYLYFSNRSNAEVLLFPIAEAKLLKENACSGLCCGLDVLFR